MHIVVGAKTGLGRGRAHGEMDGRGGQGGGRKSGQRVGGRHSFLEEGQDAKGAVASAPLHSLLSTPLLRCFAPGRTKLLPERLGSGGI